MNDLSRWFLFLYSLFLFLNQCNTIKKWDHYAMIELKSFAIKYIQFKLLHHRNSFYALLLTVYEIKFHSKWLVRKSFEWWRCSSYIALKLAICVDSLSKWHEAIRLSNVRFSPGNNRAIFILYVFYQSLRKKKINRRRRRRREKNKCVTVFLTSFHLVNKLNFAELNYFLIR